MSKYTTEVRFICETAAGYDESQGYTNVKEVIEKARPVIFDFDYDLFDPEYKPILETKILRHFYTREIAAETVGLWKLWLETRMVELMPIYNKLYESEQLKYSPLFDVDYTVEHSGNKDLDEVRKNETNTEHGGHDDNIHTGEDTRKFDGTTDTDNKTVTDTTDNGTSKTVTDANRWDYYSDTPQGGINGLAAHRYLTNARNITDNTTVNGQTTDVGKATVKGDGKTTQDNIEKTIYDSTNKTAYGKTIDTTNNGTTKATTTDAYTEHVFGKRNAQSYASLMVEYRNSLINIDKMFIEELNDLFFMLW